MPMEMERMISGYSFRYCHVAWNLTGGVVPDQPGPRPFRDLSLSCRSLCWIYVVYKSRPTELHPLQADRACLQSFVVS